MNPAKLFWALTPQQAVPEARSNNRISWSNNGILDLKRSNALNRLIIVTSIQKYFGSKKAARVFKPTIKISSCASEAWKVA